MAFFSIHIVEKNLLLSVNDTNATQPTYNEKTLEEEQKLLEEKQKKLKTEHEINVKNVEDEFKKCMSKPDISYNEQQDCYTRKHQSLNDLNTKYEKYLAEAKDYFKKQTEIICSICLDNIDCKVLW